MAAEAQVVDEVSPREPERDAVVGIKPRLRIAVRGQDWTKIQFKIELSRDSFDTVTATFDQMKEPNGWAFVGLGKDEPGAIYQLREPLHDGEYQWRVFAWNGVDWVPGKTAYRFRVDATPPADVEGLQVRVDHTAGQVSLQWSPVSLDKNGRPELVSVYHVYRYERKWFFSSYGAYEIGTTEETAFVDKDEDALNGPLIFYKVTAEDAAGNETDRRH